MFHLEGRGVVVMGLREKLILRRGVVFIRFLGVDFHRNIGRSVFFLLGKYRLM